MKKITTILAMAFSLGLNAQTVGDKSTQLGYDLGQKVIDNGAVIKVFQRDTTFVCYRISAPIPPDTNQLGSTQNFYYYDSSKNVDSTFTINTPKDTIWSHYKIWLSKQPYTEKSKSLTITTK